MPPNTSLVKLVGAASPLKSNPPKKISFYGDSITWLGLYEGVINKALESGRGTKNLSIELINQGVNGGTVSDLVIGYSPW